MLVEYNAAELFCGIFYGKGHQFAVNVNNGIPMIFEM